MFSTQLHFIKREGQDRVVLETSAGRIGADLVVAGIGVMPNVNLAQQAALEVADGLLDAAGQSSHPRVWGAGEVTCLPVKGQARGRQLESWQVAEKQARA